MNHELTADTLAALYTRHRPGLNYHAWKVLRDPAAAEEAVQEAMLRAWAHREDYEGRSNPLTWIISIVWNVARERLRYRLRPLQASQFSMDEDFDLSDDLPGADRLADSRRIAERVESAIRGLSAREQMLMRLRFYEDMGPVDVAAATGIRPDHVRLLLFRATRKVRKAVANA